MAEWESEMITDEKVAELVEQLAEIDKAGTQQVVPCHLAEAEMLHLVHCLDQSRAILSLKAYVD